MTAPFFILINVIHNGDWKYPHSSKFLGDVVK